MTIQNLQDHKATSNQALSLLFIGPSGVGKSIAACSWPGPIYVACLDDRMTSVREYYKGLRDDIFVEVFNNFNELDEAIDKLEFECKYRTVVIDPVTFLSDMLMRYSFGLRGADGTSKGRNKGVVDLTTVEDFGVEYQGITQIMGNLKIAQARHNFNIIFCAHVIKTDYYKVGGLISHSTETIVTQGKKIAAKIPAMFDEVYSFYVDSTTGDQMCRTASDGIVPARSSFKGMPKEFKWTNSPSLYNGLCKFYDVASLKTGETK